MLYLTYPERESSLIIGSGSLDGSPPWLPPEASIWALVNGYAPSIRVKKPLAFLQAFIDDSASHVGDRRLVMAGYLNGAQNWALFSTAWNDELKAAPAIEYFKMGEAHALNGQFRGFSEAQRDEKIRGLVRVVRHFQPISFEFSVSQEQFTRVLKAFSPRGINPHFICCFGIVATIAGYVASSPVVAPIDFIFDAQDGVDEDIALFFSAMKNNLPKDRRNLIRSSPMFRDDKEFLPLQAADLLAWHIRRAHEVAGREALPLLDLLRGENAHVMGGIPDDILEVWQREFSQLPNVNQLQTKAQWRRVKKNLVEAMSKGFIPPHGTRWKNFWRGLRAKFRR